MKCKVPGVPPSDFRRSTGFLGGKIGLIGQRRWIRGFRPDPAVRVRACPGPTTDKADILPEVEPNGLFFETEGGPFPYKVVAFLWEEISAYVLPLLYVSPRCP